MCAGRVFTTLRRAEYAELIGLFFLIGAALAMWFVPLSAVLEAHGLGHIRPVAFASSGVAAFISPLLFGAMADRHASPVKVLRGLALATAITVSLATTAIQEGWGPLPVLAFIQLHSLCSSPTWSIASTIILARLRDAPREFGPVRAMATFGWMGGCLWVSLIGADRSTASGYSGAVLWLVVVAFTFLLPSVESPRAGEARSWVQRLGLDALTLLKIRDHRVVFLTTTLFTIPLAGFYPYAPPHLKELGLERMTAWMSLGQITEVIAMFALGGLILRWRLKWIIAAGLGFGVIRFVVSALDTRTGLIAGIVLHGCSFTLVNITAQIYLDQRVEPSWRGRAQALLSLMNGGFGNLLGYLGTGAWFAACSAGGKTQWSAFWLGLAVSVAGVLAVFLVAYRGRSSGLTPPPFARSG